MFENIICHATKKWLKKVVERDPRLIENIAYQLKN
jgi:hypothetical protein